MTRKTDTLHGRGSAPKPMVLGFRSLVRILYDHRVRVFLWLVAFWFGWDFTMHGGLDRLIAKVDFGGRHSIDVPEGIRRTMANDPKPGSMVDLIQLTTVDGRTVKFPSDAPTEFIGLLFVQDCPSCRVDSDIRVAEELQRQARDKLTVYVVMVGADRDTAGAYWSTRNFSIPLLVDPTGEVAKRLNALFLPRGYVIHRTGRLEYVTGYREPYDQVKMKVNQVLTSGGPVQ